MISNKTKKSDYICLSKKDRDEKRKWFSKKSVKNKKSNKQLLDEMADKLKNKSYQHFLNSDYWKIVRKRVMKRDGSKCVVCHSTKNLHVHHDSYKNHFREHRNLKDLMVLCEKCHTEHHYCTD